ncbi:hypothetical protein HU719_021165 [Pseudomonas sp. SWRI107]|uniref:hypothetical protein n=1 Tax=Pseudomonas TaxID=286 RepID=UPI00164533BF|nr:MULTISPECIES: hypothetical protein [Pseudomonas]MBC3409968.1 hypothetical protein [Pseudomonas sp. SWRI51]MBV4533904.1 hypothetical protein [Pseudomonas farsensis]
MTTFAMNFDFNSAPEMEVLEQLQKQGYYLLGFKGAEGPNQLTAGVPTWFSVPFGDIFGKVAIEYTPKYKLYVTTQRDIAANTTIEMEKTSGELSLGNAQTFNPSGGFVSGGVTGVPADSLGLFNNRPAGTPPLTVGLAGLVATPQGDKYLPFCAFTLNPQGSIVMKPLDNILLVAAQRSLKSGNVQASVSAPGCTFAFSASAIKYELQVLPSTYAISNRPGAASVNPVSSGSTIGTIINSPR